MRSRTKHVVCATLAAWIAAAACSARAARPPAGDVVVVSECEDAGSWDASGNVKISTQLDNRREGNRVLSLTYSGKGGGWATAPAVKSALTETHAFSFNIRGASPVTKARFWVYLTSDNGASFRKEMGIANFEWSTVFLLPQDFIGWQRARNAKGQGPNWSAIRTVLPGEIPPASTCTVRWGVKVPSPRPNSVATVITSTRSEASTTT